MEPLSHYQCEKYCCKPVPINLHQTTCNQPVPITCKQIVPITCANMYHASTCTLYHKQVPSTMYQVCTNHASTMTHQDVPTSSTIHLMYVPTHQLLVSTMYSTCTSTKIPHQFHHPNLICNSVGDLVYMITYLQTFLNFNNKRLAFSSNFTLVSHD
jgi:hypothetical protein